jgi:hypothetical protein
MQQEEDLKPQVDQPMISEELLKNSLPKHLRGLVTDSLVSTVNSIANTDGVMRDSFRDNLIGYMHVLQDGKYKIQDYISAVRYCSYRLMGRGITDSYRSTFPDRYARLIQEGATANHISGFASAYNKNKLVNLIMEQSLIPTYVLNQDLYQEAINVQAELMRSANSEKVRSDAANSLLTHLKQPETRKIEIEMGVKESKSIEELREATRALAQAQLAAINTGAMSVVDVAHSRIIQGTCEEQE